MFDQIGQGLLKMSTIPFYIASIFMAMDVTDCLFMWIEFFPLVFHSIMLAENL